MTNEKTDKKKTTKPKKYRNLMYVQQTRFLAGLNKEKILEVIDRKFKNVEYAYILHDKDTYTETNELPPGAILGGKKLDHIHIAMSFTNARTIESVADALGVASNTIEKFDGRYGKPNMFAYLIHKTTRAIELGKHQYDVSEVTANFDYAAYMDNSANNAQSRNMDIDEVLAGIIRGDIILKDFFREKYFDNVDAAGLFYTKHKPKIDRAISVRYNIQMSAHPGEGGSGLELIYIQGDAGSGKTTLAKEYAMRKYGDYFISGSKNDSVQDYMGEPVAIFDDARPTDFDTSDWLKMLDPYTNKSSVTSRFYNKYLAVKCIILTTTTPFHEFFVYAPGKGGVKEPVAQFMRRFSTVISVQPKIENDERYAIGKLFEVKELDKPVSKRVGHSRIDFNYWPEEVLNAEIKVKIPESDNADVVKSILSYF